MAVDTWVQARFTVLFIALLTLMFSAPIVEHLGGLEWVVLDALFTGLILAVLYAMSRERYFLLLAVFLAMPALATRWGVRLTDHPVLVVASFVAQISFLGVSVSLLLAEILRSSRVTTDTIFGGISVYMLIGINFALVFGLIDFLDPTALSIPAADEGGDVRLPGSAGFAEMVYFSFVTITTLGYGDIVPIAKPARTMAVLEAVIGQVYLAVFVARLVGLHMAHNQPGRLDT